MWLGLAEDPLPSAHHSGKKGTANARHDSGSVGSEFGCRLPSGEIISHRIKRETAGPMGSAVLLILHSMLAYSLLERKDHL